MGISRQAIYQAEHRFCQRAIAMQPVTVMVQDIRRFMPQLGTRKLYHLLKLKFESCGIKLGRDGLFNSLRRENLLIKKARNYHKTTHSKHWMKNISICLKG